MFVCLLEPAVLKDVFASKVLKFSNLLHKVDNKHSIFIFFFSNKLCLCPHFHLYYFLCLFFFFPWQFSLEDSPFGDLLKTQYFNFGQLFIFFLIAFKEFFVFPDL